MLDVGQGDSFLFHSKGKSLLIDTGGRKNFFTEEWQKKEESSIVLNMTIPYLKSRGIRKLDYVFLTHGDFDHLGEAQKLLENYSVQKLFINEGNINYFERKLIKRKNIVKVCREGFSFQLGEFQFLSLNHDLGDENSSSIVFYIVYHQYKMMFMGDANFKSEEYILKNYDLSKINLLKLGHHGSRTSSSDEFLKAINPDIAFISAGKDNQFNHPHTDTMKRLKKYHISSYCTKDLGIVEVNFEKRRIIF